MGVTYATGAEIRVDLTDAFIEATRPQVVYDKIFSPLPVDTRVGAIKVAPFSTINQVPTTITRTPNTSYAESSLELQSVLYECEDVGLQISIDQAEKYPNNIEQAAAQALRYRLDGEIEYAAVQKLLTGNTPAISSANNNLTTVSTAWTTATSDPIVDVSSAIEAMSAVSGGLLPDTLVLPQTLYIALKNHPDILARMPVTALQGDESVGAALASIFGIDRVLVARANRGTSVIWPQNIAILAITAPPNSLPSTPAACRTVYWADDGDISREGWVVETLDKEETRSHIIRARRNAGMLVITTRGLYGLQMP